MKCIYVGSADYLGLTELENGKVAQGRMLDQVGLTVLIRSNCVAIRL